MSAVVKQKLLLYADDSAILVTGKNKDDIESLLSIELETVREWLICNKLSLHLGKTESILFGSKQKVKTQSALNISCNGHPIQSKDSVKYLGATIDQSLSFETMAMAVIQKVNSRLKFMYRKRDFLNFHAKKLLIMAIAQCHFDYASVVWFYSTTQTIRNNLQVTQNKLIRFVLNLDSRAHIGKEQFSYLKWLPVASRVDFKTLCHVFNVHNKSAPSYMGNDFIPASSVHSHKTRFTTKAVCQDDNQLSFAECGRFSVPKVKSFGIRSFAYRGCSLWNDLPQSIRDSSSLNYFKSRAKEHFIERLDS